MIDDLKIVINFIGEDVRRIQENVGIELEKTKGTENSLDRLETELASLQKQLGVEIKGHPDSSERSPELYATEKCAVEITDWEDIVSLARKNLSERGCDFENVFIDHLIDEAELKRIERRFSGGFQLESNLDRYDTICAIVAGIVAAAVDFFLVKIPADHKYLGTIMQEGSPLTKWLQEQSDSEQHWIAKMAKGLENDFKVSFDKVKEVAGDIQGFGPRTHRLQTFGHDPLLGLIVGTIDIMRGGLTAVSREGVPVFLSGQGEANYNPLEALVYTIMHMLSDFPTKMGIPAPGFSLLQAFNIGSFGEKDRTVGEMARFMYLKGYDSRHFLTMGTSVAAAELVLRSCFWIRRKLDPDYEDEMKYLGEIANAKKTGDHPRFIGMALTAHTVASACNAGKVVVYAGNPLAINYTQWLRFLHSAYRYIGMKWNSPTNILTRKGNLNSKILLEGWPDLGVSDPGFPELIVR